MQGHYERLDETGWYVYTTDGIKQIDEELKRLENAKRKRNKKKIRDY